MDIAGILAAVGPEAGIGGLLLVLLALTMRHASTERTGYQSSLESARTRYAAELADVYARLDAVEAKNLELQTQLDEERRLRREAEDAAAQARREAGTA